MNHASDFGAKTHLHYETLHKKQIYPSHTNISAKCVNANLYCGLNGTADSFLCCTINLYF